MQARMILIFFLASLVGAGIVFSEEKKENQAAPKVNDEKVTRVLDPVREKLLQCLVITDLKSSAKENQGVKDEKEEKQTFVMISFVLGTDGKPVGGLPPAGGFSIQAPDRGIQVLPCFFDIWHTLQFPKSDITEAHEYYLKQ